MELLSFGKAGWGDELFYAALMTVAVSLTAMLIGFFFALISMYSKYPKIEATYIIAPLPPKKKR